MKLESKYLFIAAAVVVLSAASFARAQGHLLQKGLVASWSCDGHAKDSAGNNHGKVGPGVAFTADRHGNAKGAFLFNGKNTHVDCGAPDLKLTDKVTVAAWVKPKAFNADPDYSTIATRIRTWYFQIDRAGKLAVFLQRVFPKGSDYCLAAKALPLNVWSHVTFTYDGKSLKIYVNGVLSNSFLLKGRLSRDDMAYHIGIGVNLDTKGKPYPGYNRRFNGAIDDVGIWNRALSAEEIQGVFKLRRPGDGLAAGLPHITRVASSDRIELTDRNVLLGTVESESYIIDTASIGKIKIPAAQVIGIVAGTKKDPRVRIVLTDGQVVAGKMTEQAVQLTFADNSSPLKIPISKIRQFGYRVSKGRPTAPVASGPIVTLAGGYRLVWTECKQKLQLRTPGGAVDLPIKGVVKIQAIDPAGSAYKVVFRNGSTLTGALLGEKLTLKLQLGPTLTCPIGDVRGFVMLARHVEPTGPATVKMRNGDQLFGKITDKTLTVRTEFGDVKIHPGNMMSMVFDSKNTGQMKVKTWDGARISGRLVAPTVTVSIGPDGPSVKVTAVQIASITSSSAQPPPEVLKKAQQLIAQLGAESFEDRQAASKALIAMGKDIVGLLKKHAKSSDPEIRQRIHDILEQLGVKE